MSYNFPIDFVKKELFVPRAKSQLFCPEILVQQMQSSVTLVVHGVGADSCSIHSLDDYDPSLYRSIKTNNITVVPLVG